MAGFRWRKGDAVRFCWVREVRDGNLRAVEIVVRNPRVAKKKKTFALCMLYLTKVSQCLFEMS